MRLEELAKLTVMNNSSRVNTYSDSFGNDWTTILNYTFQVQMGRSDWQSLGSQTATYVYDNTPFRQGSPIIAFLV